MQIRFQHICFRFAMGIFLASVTSTAFAESQGPEYKGITDPFGDPASYEFSDDEREDKEFFHLGRFLMLGIDLGLGVFTGGLGSSTQPGLLIGGHFLYFFDRSFALELAGHYANHLDELRQKDDDTQGAQIDTNFISFLPGFRYYFDTRSAPKAIAVANPYLAFAGGIYLRDQAVVEQTPSFNLSSGSTTSFGINAGAGIEFDVYHRHLYLGIDIRYHMIFFPDANETFGDKVEPGSRGGGYLTPKLSITYNF